VAQINPGAIGASQVAFFQQYQNMKKTYSALAILHLLLAASIWPFCYFLINYDMDKAFPPSDTADYGFGPAVIVVYWLMGIALCAYVSTFSLIASIFLFRRAKTPVVVFAALGGLGPILLAFWLILVDDFVCLLYPSAAMLLCGVAILVAALNLRKQLLNEARAV
jgi:hypothetical protein